MRHVGTRSVVVVVIKDSSNINKEYQRDTGMVLLKKHKLDDIDPEAMRERSVWT